MSADFDVSVEADVAVDVDVPEEDAEVSVDVDVDVEVAVDVVSLVETSQFGTVVPSEYWKTVTSSTVVMDKEGLAPSHDT